MPEKQVPVARWEGGRAQAASDSLGAEEPVEIRVEYSFKDRREIATLGLTLASPGQEEDLACGLLHAEGWLTGAAQIEGIHVQPGSVLVALRPGVEPVATARRHLARTAACGLCGREDLPGLASPPEASAVTPPAHRPTPLGGSHRPAQRPGRLRTTAKMRRCASHYRCRHRRALDNGRRTGPPAPHHAGRLPPPRALQRLYAPPPDCGQSGGGAQVA